MSDSEPTLLSRLLKPEIHALLEARKWGELREALREWPAPEVAELLMELEPADRVLLFRALRRERAAQVFSHLEAEDRNAFLATLTDEDTRHLLANLPPDDRTELLEELPGQVTQRLLNLLSPEDLEEARTLLGYPEESVGRLMTPDYVAVRPEWTVARALEHVRKVGRASETIYRIYVVDGRWVLLDDIELRRLILADPEKTIAEVMDHTFVSIPAFADREEAIALIRRYDVLALPVLDSDGVLVGIVTVDDILDVQEEEATEDFHKSASVGPLQMSLRTASVPYLYQRRIGWLLILVVMNIFSGAGIAYYEDTIAATVALVFFLPLLIDSAGNAGSQAATLMVRALATGDARAKDWIRLLVKELGVSSLMGVTMAAAVVVIAFWRGGPDVAVVVGLTMSLVVVMGSLIGMSLPFLLNRLKLDPATASAPLVTSIADISGVLIYFSLATWYLGVGNG
jgi:magnesium transporter